MSVYPIFVLKLCVLTMTAYKDKITLVVERNDLSALEFRNMREECLKHATHSMTQSGIEVVEDDFRVVGCDNTMALWEARKNVSNHDYQLHCNLH